MVLGFLFGIFLIWRLSRAWDLDEEKVLDLILLTFIGALAGARFYFAIENWHLFAASPFNLILINKVPGFSFWGGFSGGWLTLFFLSRRRRFNFWQLTDIAIPGLLGGLIFADLGCFLGGCNIGVPSKLFFAVTQVGSVGKRIPVQVIESLILAIILVKIWSQATHFHQRGKIAGLGLSLIGGTKLLAELFKQSHSDGIFAGSLFVLGLVILYKATKQSPVDYFTDLVRNLTLQNLSRYWYNQKTNASWQIRNLKKILRRKNVKFS